MATNYMTTDKMARHLGMSASRLQSMWRARKFKEQVHWHVLNGVLYWHVQAVTAKLLRGKKAPLPPVLHSAPKTQAQRERAVKATRKFLGLS